MLSDIEQFFSSILHRKEKYQAYERYLQSVVDILPPDYLDVNEPHINDIIMRHKTLIETNEDLMRTVVKCQDEIDRRQKGLQELVKEKNDNILVYNSTMGTQQKKFDKLKQECAYLEQKQEEHDRTGRERVKKKRSEMESAERREIGKICFCFFLYNFFFVFSSQMRILGESKLAINNLFDRVNVARGKSITSAVNNNNNNNNVSNNNNNNSNNDQYVNSHSNAVAIALLSGGTAGGVITNTSTTQKPPQQQTAAGTDAPLGNSNAVAAQHDSVADSMTLTEKLNAIAQRIIDLQRK